MVLLIFEFDIFQNHAKIKKDKVVKIEGLINYYIVNNQYNVKII